MITLRKCWRLNRAGARQPQHQASAPADSSDSGGGWEFIDRQPTPEEAVLLAETVEELMRGLDERDRRILELRLQGCTAPEISRQVGLTQYAVEGVLKWIRKRLRRMRDQELSET